MMYIKDGALVNITPSPAGSGYILQVQRAISATEAAQLIEESEVYEDDNF